METEHPKGVSRVIVFVFLITQVIGISGLYYLVSAALASHEYYQILDFPGEKPAYLQWLFNRSALGFPFSYSRMQLVLAFGQVAIAGLALAATVLAKSRPQHVRSILSTILLVLVGFTATQASLRSFIRIEWPPFFPDMEWAMHCHDIYNSAPANMVSRASDIDPTSEMGRQLAQAEAERDACLESWDPYRSSIAGRLFPPGRARQWFWVFVQLALYLPILAFLNFGRRHLSDRHANPSERITLRFPATDPTEQRMSEILSVLDECNEGLRFPALDNAYVYPAATRLSLFRSEEDWALVIEVFGFSPRAGLPDLHISTFASRIEGRKAPEDFISPKAYLSYMEHNPHNESRFVFPIAEGTWQDQDYLDVLAAEAREIPLRGRPIQLPHHDDYAEYGILLEEPYKIFVFEASRFLAETHRDEVLATEEERRFNVPPELKQIMVLDEWAHPDVLDGSTLPSSSETFQQLARVLATGDLSAYNPTEPPNTHWSNWPEGGLL